MTILISILLVIVGILIVMKAREMPKDNSWFLITGVGGALVALSGLYLLFNVIIDVV